MPVSVITDVITWIEMIAQIGVTTVELGVLSYLVFDNGWLDMIRLISFWCDRLIIKYVDKFYSYFDKILNGTIFAPEVIERVMSGVYLFVTVLVLFKLIMLFMKYIVNPDMVQDEKIGTASLIKRVIIGMCLMLFLGNIFTLGYRLQSAILSDNLFGQVLLTKSQLRSYEKNKNQMGRVLAFNVYQGFWNLDTTQVNSSAIVNKYKNAITAKDPGVFGNINEKYGDDYAVDYFPILSTVILFYVLYLVIKYCIDIVVRMFKLFVLQMLGPIAITDYMVNGDSKDMFKSWTKTTIAAYAMLFMRVFCIWFVAFITILMNEKCTTVENGVCTDSMLYLVEGQDPDYLLRALITLGLLAFLMDLPKLLSEIFGLDLEQDASVKGLMQKVGGAGKMLGMGALAAGGAAIGGAIGAAKSGANSLKQFGNNKAQTQHKLSKLNPNDPNYAQKQKNIKQQASLQNRTLASSSVGAFGGAMTGVMASALGQTPLSAVSSGYQNASSSAQNKANEYGNSTAVAIKGREEQMADIKSEEEKEKAEKAEEATKDFRSHMTGAANTMVAQQAVANHTLGNIEANSEVTAKQTVNIEQQLGTVSGNIDAIAQNTETTAQQMVNVEQQLGTVSGNIDAIAQNTETTAQQIVNVEQQLGSIDGKIDTISDNTEITAQQTVNIDQQLGSIDGKVDTISDNIGITAEQTKSMDESLRSLDSKKKNDA